MKKKIKKLTAGTYHVQGKCTYFEKNKICNFFIKNILYTTHNNIIISYTVTLESEEEHQTETFSAAYIDEPYIWLKLFFNNTAFKIYTTRSNYNRRMNEIINTFDDNHCIENNEYHIGWYFESNISKKNNRL